MAHLSASIGSCKRAIIFRRRSITLSIFANFPLCGRVISTRRPPLSPGPAGQPGRRVARPHSRRASLIIPSVIVFVSQLVISHSGIIVTCNLPCQPARPLPLYVVRLLALILMSRSSPRSLPLALPLLSRQQQHTFLTRSDHPCRVCDVGQIRFSHKIQNQLRETRRTDIIRCTKSSRRRGSEVRG